jgi:hypothetical protein
MNDLGTILFSLDVGINEDGFPVYVSINEEIQKEMLSEGVSVSTVLSDIFMGFLFEWCRDNFINPEELFAQHLERDKEMRKNE